MPDKRELKDWFDTYMYYTHGSLEDLHSEPPINYHKWMAIATIAAALQRKCRIRWGSITFYPNFYIILVAPAGQARKGTAMDFAKGFLDRLMIPMSPDATSLQALIRRMSECTNTEEEAEKGYFESHSSLTAFSPELTVFLGFANKELISNLCDFYDCRNRFVYETISRNAEEIVGVFLNLVGATTPELIQGSMSADTIGSGLPSRMIFVYEPRIVKRVVYPFFTLSNKGQVIEQQLVKDLTQIRSLKGDFKVSKDFLDLWTDWYGNYPDICPFDPTHFGGYWERRPTHIMKMSMVMSASRSNSMLLTENDLKKSIKLLEDTEQKMANVFNLMGRSDQADTIQKVMNFVARYGEVSMTQLMQKFLMFVSEVELDQILGSLRASKFIHAPISRGSEIYIKHKGLGEL
ncbi:hypothetical protein KAX02_13610 [candidate division WOR-3 bacterium]|nr:hypothetical protein [candidate division WOR-3 bacterium]